MISDFVLNLVKANITLALLYLTYIIGFRHLKEYKLNRFFLVFIVVFSLLSPYLTFSFPVIPGSLIKVDYLYLAEQEVHIDWQGGKEEVTPPGVTMVEVLSYIYIIVCCILLTRFISRIVIVFRAKAKSKREIINGERVFIANLNNGPFTFLHYVFLPEDYIYLTDNTLILKHEKAHAKQLHTIDVLLAEILSILCWFNPLVFLLKKSLKNVHEYLADDAAIRSGGDELEYLNLLSVCTYTRTTTGISSNFYWLTIKSRINMIAKNKTSKRYRLLYLLVIPLFSLIILSFNSAGNNPEGLNLLKSEKKYTPSISPIEFGKIIKISGYGLRMHPIKKVEMMHKGVDFAALLGTPVVATADGIVIKRDYNEKGTGYGNLILIQHDEVHVTLYSQLSEFKVDIGDKVKKGEVIGLVGSSGYSTGPHLHYEVRKNGENVNPELYYNLD